MSIEKGLTIDIQKTAKRVYKKDLSAHDQKAISSEILSDKEFIEVYERKMLEHIRKHIESEESPLTYVYTFGEAVEAWNISESTLRNYLNERGRGKEKLKDQLKRGIIKKHVGTWIITKQAMQEAFGEPKEKELNHPN